MWLTNRSSDACLEIVKMAVETSQRTTVLIGSHVSTRHREEGKIICKPQADSSFEMYRLKEMIGHDMCFQLLFIHSISGSEMTSRIFGVGKTAFQKLAKGDPVLQYCVYAFTFPNQTALVI